MMNFIAIDIENFKVDLYDEEEFIAPMKLKRLIPKTTKVIKIESRNWLKITTVTSLGPGKTRSIKLSKKSNCFPLKKVETMKLSLV